MWSCANADFSKSGERACILREREAIEYKSFWHEAPRPLCEEWVPGWRPKASLQSYAKIFFNGPSILKVKSHIQPATER